ncbi:MAG: type 4a pilus biogenesis protein PilO [Deltaproteobacteria bacterium]|nr:type 4a pilus biogenesis protein PilO [Deltaproteobacteria bacterium]MBW2052452.1 type 4a pilus biogenesis protein PilO [Deltaproteobacteria bacterium]MBW2140431.1 type 4a pilus biogenesis protein PilO [Deltaproteobacteria bacterium]MBW2322952.1 type 4a pilus biogenesis protein PilO [Deltaproteobacteria bacterium]
MNIKLPPFPWEQIEKLKWPHKLGIAAGVYILVLAVIGYFLLLPLFKDIKTLESQIENAKEKLAFNMSAKRRKEIKEAPIKLEKLKKELEISRRFLPDKEQVSQLLKDVSARARESGLNVYEFKPTQAKSGPLKGGFLAKVPFSMIVEGPYINIASFLYKISRLPRIVHVDSIKMSKPVIIEGDLILTSTITGTTYRFIETALPDDVLENPKKGKAKAQKK